MHSYVTHILVPHFNKHKEALGRPDQLCLWLIDVWSVHRSIEFRELITVRLKDHIIVIGVSGKD